MLCIYFSLSVQRMLTLLLQLKQTPTESSYKPSFKKKDRPDIMQLNSAASMINKTLLFPLFVSLFFCYDFFPLLLWCS